MPHCAADAGRAAAENRRRSRPPAQPDLRRQSHVIPPRAVEQLSRLSRGQDAGVTMVRRLRVPFVVILALVAAAAVWAQQPQLPIADGQVLRLWEGAAPGALGSDE